MLGLGLGLGLALSRFCGLILGLGLGLRAYVLCFSSVLHSQGLRKLQLASAFQGCKHCEVIKAGSGDCGTSYRCCWHRILGVTRGHVVPA